MAVARVAQREGKLDDARRHYERAVEVRERGLGETHPRVAHALGHFGRMLVGAGEAAEALPMFERERAILVEAYGEQNRQAATAGIDLAWARVRLGDVAGAREMYRDAAAVFAGSLEGRGGGAARSLFNLGCLAALLGEREEALEWLRRALDRGLDPEHLRKDDDLESLRGDPEFEALAP